MRLTEMEMADAILEQLRLLHANPDRPISLYAIGVPLIGAGYSQDQILNALLYLESTRKLS